MKKLILIFTSSLLLSCTGGISNPDTEKLLNEYYSNQGCYSQLKDDGNYNNYEKLRKDGQYKAIAWIVESINGVLLSDDGNSATVDFTLKGEETVVFKYQRINICGAERDFGPWNMTTELLKYDSGWKIKSKPISK